MKVIHVVGARPNFMKVAPIMAEMAKFADTFEQILVHTGQHYDDNMEFLLMRVDKMSMATSVEGRVPYLDHELVRFALAIPSALKYRRGRTKHILKEAARGILPDDVIDRPKTGFCGGASNMVTDPIVDHAEQVITNSDWLRSLLNIEAIRPLLAEHRAGRRDHGMAIWNLLNLTLWRRHWIEQEPIVT